MVKQIDVEITRKADTIAQYVKIPRDLVMDSAYPFDREAETQNAILRIDENNKVIIIELVKSKSEE